MKKENKEEQHQSENTSLVSRSVSLCILPLTTFIHCMVCCIYMLSLVLVPCLYTELSSGTLFMCYIVFFLACFFYCIYVMSLVLALYLC